jgi:hypothetical protein
MTRCTDTDTLWHTTWRRLQVLSLACAGVVALLLRQAWRRGRASLGSPPLMEPDLGEPADVAAGTAVPTDPYTALKQNYDGVVTFLMTVSGCVGGGL